MAGAMVTWRPFLFWRMAVMTARHAFRFRRFPRTAAARCRAARCILALLFICASPLAQGDELDELLAMAQAGASTLALQLLDDHQPDGAPAGAEWMRWERARIEILQSHADWRAVIDRLTDLPREVSPDFARWAMKQRARAHLELGEGRPARELLSSLIWGAAGPIEGETLADLRRGIIRAYLLEGRVEDAYTALVRYRQDYGDVGAGWEVLAARVLLRANRPAEAMRVLEAKRDPEGEGLHLLARLRAGADQGAVLDDALKLAASIQVPPAVRFQAAAVAVAIADHKGNKAARAEALEYALALQTGVTERDPLFVLSADADHLWHAYLELGYEKGNKAHLLVGRDADWEAAATRVLDATPVTARALFAVLALATRAPDSMTRAHTALAMSLVRDGRGELLRALYLQSQRFPQVQDVPAPVRALLAPYALQAEDDELARRLVDGLAEAAPAGIDPVHWRILYASALVLKGDMVQAAELFRWLLRGEEALTQAQEELIAQGALRLLREGRPREAAELLEGLLRRGAWAGREHAMFHWLGEAYQAQGRFLRAARAYLKSAAHARESAPWSYYMHARAAQALASGGLVADARRVYGSMLQESEEPARHALIEGELRRLLPAVPDIAGQRQSQGTER